MRHIKGYLFVLILLCFAGLSPVLAQNPTAGSTPVVVDDDEVVKIDTNLIQVDAIVTDKNGKIITDLKPEDFDLTENGKKRTIVGFSFVNTDVRAANFSNDLILTSTNSTLSDTPSRTIGQVGRIYAIVVDDFRLSKTGMDYAKKDLLKFVQTEVQPGDLVAVIKTSGSIGVLQKFTTDKEELLATIESLKPQLGSMIGVESFPPLSGIAFSQQVLSSIQGAGLSDAQLNRVSAGGAESISEGVRESINSVGGLQVLIKVIEAMGYMRGKKSILYVSHGLQADRLTGKQYSDSDRSVIGTSNGNAYSLVDEDSITVAGRTYVVNNFLRVVTEAANRNGVSIFPIDPRGAATTSIRASNDTGGGDAGSMVTVSKLGDSTFSGAQSARDASIRFQQESLKYMARETGGKAFVNSNQVAADLKESLDIQKGYYLLAYEPDAETFDPKNSKYNKFDIKVKRPGATVNFRTGFFNTVVENKVKAPTEAQTILEKILTPYNYADIGVELSSIYAGTAGAKSTIRSFVNILPKDLTINTDAATGKKSAKFDVYVAVFNDQGLAAGTTAANFNVAFDPKVSEGFLKSGLISSVAFEVTKPGVYRVKVLVKDSGSNRMGTVSQNIYVPDLEKQPISFSGILLQTFSPAEYQELQKNPAASSSQRMQIDTAFRHFKKGQVLTYTYAVNTSLKGGDSKITLNAKLIKDGKVVLSVPAEEAAVTPGGKFNRRNAVNLGTDMQKGKYTLQITAIGDKTTAGETQSIDFEIVD